MVERACGFQSGRLQSGRQPHRAADMGTPRVMHRVQEAVRRSDSGRAALPRSPFVARRAVRSVASILQNAVYSAMHMLSPVLFIQCSAPIATPLLLGSM